MISESQYLTEGKFSSKHPNQLGGDYCSPQGRNDVVLNHGWGRGDGKKEKEGERERERERDREMALRNFFSLNYYITCLLFEFLLRI